eukprot:CAMPEP_0168608272 /NCGR_PEP_ID=MMETSP0449_2-20121227/534_1 /TAXON_ID=1082188 /ORGANISM="Strombidium rassoulzadegani, Strain ras09" /LENGTH=201 /DNA_ID=CAMNT_0008648237 /DNA_START=315 /DNA_END=916 /DNA_ORIENTATION=+
MARELWPAFRKWQDDDYLRERVGDEMVMVEEISRDSNEFSYITRDYQRAEMLYSEFIRVINDEKRDRNYYLAEQDILQPLKRDITEPYHAQAFLSLDKVYMWDGIGTKSLPHQDDAENIMCVVRGFKTFYIVSPFQSHFVYSGQKENYPNNYSPVDFLEPDLEKFPLFKQARVFEVKIEAGDCLFLPTFWWHQVNSSPERT